MDVQKWDTYALIALLDSGLKTRVSRASRRSPSRFRPLVQEAKAAPPNKNVRYRFIQLIALSVSTTSAYLACKSNRFAC